MFDALTDGYPGEGDLLERATRLEADIAEVVGVLNAAHGRLVDLVGVAVDQELWGGPGIKSPAHWLCWQAGLAPGRAQGIVAIAERRAQVPTAVDALRQGLLSVDAASEVARKAPSSHEATATELAKGLTVTQLRNTLRDYDYGDEAVDDPRTPKARPNPEERTVSMGTDHQGWWLRGRLPADQGAVVEAAVRAARDDLWRQGYAAAKAAAEAADRSGSVEAPEVSLADGLLAAAEASLRAGEAAHPGTDRYLVHAHLQARPTPDQAGQAGQGDQRSSRTGSTHPTASGPAPPWGLAANPGDAAGSGGSPASPTACTCGAPDADPATVSPAGHHRAESAGARRPSAPGAGDPVDDRPQPGSTDRPADPHCPRHGLVAALHGPALDPAPNLVLHQGMALPEALRHLITCDATCVPVLERDGVPVSVGRRTRVVSRRLRRLIEHRDRGCRIPGCGQAHGLEIHHIVHWEHGGPTDTDNLVALCPRHHRDHHLGILDVAGNPELPADNPGALTVHDRWGRIVPGLATPAPPPATATVDTVADDLRVHPDGYRRPFGEPLDRLNLYLPPDDVSRARPPGTAGHPGPPAVEVPPVPQPFPERERAERPGAVSVA